MKIIKIFAIVLISVYFVSGCTFTRESSPDYSAYVESTPVPPEHKYYQAIRVGETHNFIGTSAFLPLGRYNPNLNNESAKEALGMTLDHAGMLSKEPSLAKYEMDMTMVEEVDRPNGFSVAWNGVDRNYRIRYVLRLIYSNSILYDEIIESSGSAGYRLAYYNSEKAASERSHQKNFEKLVNDLKSAN